MKTKPPPRRRKFAGPWDEIGYFHDQLLFWLYRRVDVEKARRCAGQLRQLLSQTDPNNEAILGEECRSLVCEAEGDWQGAIRHRENEIRLMRRLEELSRGKPFEAVALRGRGPAELRDRLVRLATLYRNGGNLDKAIETLQESKMYANEHGIAFEDEALLKGYTEEKRLKLFLSQLEAKKAANSPAPRT